MFKDRWIEDKNDGYGGYWHTKDDEEYGNGASISKCPNGFEVHVRRRISDRKFAVSSLYELRPQTLGDGKMLAEEYIDQLMIIGE
jgi:hypothetical protein